MPQYSFDTSAWLQCWARSYPRDVFPALWERLEGLLDSGAIICSDEVLRELAKQEDDLTKWLRTRPESFIELGEEVQDAVNEILGAHPYLAKELARRTHADPFVVAVAKVQGCTVVTQEDRGSDAKPRIPLVCETFDIPCIDIITFIREEEWTF